MVPELDRVMAALHDDLKLRELPDRTVVLAVGEFGRTPTINASLERDHFASAWSEAIFGGGIKGGAVFGMTDEDGKTVIGDEVGAGELFATVLAAVGVNPKKEYQVGARIFTPGHNKLMLWEAAVWTEGPSCFSLTCGTRGWRLNVDCLMSDVLRPVRILIAPDKFKGSLSAPAAAEAIARGLRSVWPDAEIDLAPIADGGEGFAESLKVALGAEWMNVASEDALGRPISARYAWLAGERLAILEMSEASGLHRIAPEDRDPLRAETFGTGILIADAMRRGAQRILVGLGGSATTDGGVGMARALGFRFLEREGRDFPAAPGALESLAQIVRPGQWVLPEIFAACDVQNPLLGERGAARVYGPQKGADGATVALLDRALTRLADVCATDLGCDHRDVPGSGAAGGLGFGLLTFCRAKIRPGFDMIAETLRLGERIAAADLVITGEGRIDDQTLDGKGPAGVAALARHAGRRVIAFGGAITAAAENSGAFDALIPIADRPMAIAEAMADAAPLLERASRRAAQLMRCA
jgi:glycerate kinase